MSEIAGIDHAVIATRDLDRARRQYQRLGFAPTPRGQHPSLGSINHCLMLSEGNYLELLGLASPDAPRPYYRDFLERREGLAAIALQTDDAAAARQRLAQAGLQPTELVRFGRPVELPEGTRQAQFATTDIALTQTPGGRVFLCQHFTRDLVWRSEYLTHPNGALGLAAITIVVEDPTTAAVRYRQILGVEPVCQTGAASLTCGPSLLRLTTPAAFADRHRGDPVVALVPPYMAGIAIKVRDRERAAALLQSNGVPHRQTAGGGIRIDSTEAVGAILELI